MSSLYLESLRVRMLSKFCSAILFYTGVHPDYSLGKARIAVNTIVTFSACFLGLINVCKAKEGETMESCCIFLLVLTQFGVLSFGRQIIKRLLKSMEHFWEVHPEDEPTKFLLTYLERVNKLIKCILVCGTLLFAIKPIVLKETSSYHIYKPVLFNNFTFYIYELYFTFFQGITYSCSNILMCTFIMTAAVQFRQLNLKIKALNCSIVDDKEDFSTCASKLKGIIEYHQFLIRFVEDLNKLLSTPLALQIAFCTSVMCLEAYVSLTKDTLLFQFKIILVSVAVVAGFFTVYGLPSQLLMDQSRATANMVYYELEWFSPKVTPLRKDFTIIIMRSQKGVRIRAGNYYTISNETIIMMVKTAYSFYTFLQTMS